MLNLIFAVLPIILIGLFLYNKDKEKEPKKLLFKLFMGGVCSCFPVLVIGGILGSFFPEEGAMNAVQLFIYVFIVIALVEEACKWFFVYQIGYNDKEFDSFYDMILYASFVALGFACFENILYVMNNNLYVALIRAISAVPGHVCDGILMGSYLSLAKYNKIKGKEDNAKKYMWMSIIVPMITHGIYDYCLFIGNPLFVLIFIVFVIGLFIICVKKVNNISKNDIKFIHKNKYCTGCGTLVNSKFCPKCGKCHE